MAHAIRERTAGLVRHVRQRSGKELRLDLATPTQAALHGAMTAFRLPAGIDPQRLRQRLWEDYRIELPVIERPEGLLIRASTYFYNTEEEVDRLAEALTALLPNESTRSD